MIYDYVPNPFGALTLHPSHVKAPKWKPAAGSPQTLHVWFMARRRERERGEINY